MASEAQIAANKKNAQKSTGPKTEEGKAKSAQNATKHGLTATSDVIKGESQEEFDAHKQQLIDDLAPRNSIQQILADRVASLSWRLKRAERIETQIFDCMLADHNFDTLGHIMKRYTTMWKEIRPYPSTQNPDLALGAVVKRDYSDEKILDRLMRYERRIENSFFKSLAELGRQKRKKPTTAPDSIFIHRDSAATPDSTFIHRDSVATPDSCQPAHPSCHPAHPSCHPAHPSCHPELDSGPQHPGKEPTRTHLPTPLRAKQTQLTNSEDTATPCCGNTYNQSPRTSGAPTKPNQTDPSPSESAPTTGRTRRTPVTKTTTRRY